MKIKSVKVFLLYGHSYFGFMTKVKNLIFTYGSNMLNVDDLYKRFVALYSSMTRFYQNMEFEPQTADILAEADRKRNAYYDSIFLIIQANLVNPDAEISQAADTLYRVVEKYDDLSYIQNKESYQVVRNFCSDMLMHEDALKKIGLNPWIQYLQCENEKYEQELKTFLAACRLDDSVVKEMRSAKGQLDFAYRDIIAKINALYLLEGHEKYKPFIEKMNNLIENHRISILKPSTGNGMKNMDIIPESFY